MRSRFSYLPQLLLAYLAWSGAQLGIQVARAQLPSGTTWALTFADEFNGASVDSMKSSNGHPWDNSSSHANNVFVSGGVLNLNSVRTSSASSSTSFSGAGVATYSGGTEVAGGELVLASSSAIEAGTSLIVANPSEFSAAMAQETQAPPDAARAAVPVPEPGTLALLLSCAIATNLALRRTIRSKPCRKTAKALGKVAFRSAKAALVSRSERQQRSFLTERSLRLSKRICIGLVKE